MIQDLPTRPDPTAPSGPPERAEEELLAAVASIAGTLEAGAQRSDAQGRLVEETVHALRSHGLWRMRLCRELGGLELPIVSQIRVLAALAEVDTSSAWCTMVANNAVAVLGATMPDAAVEQVFADGVPSASIVAAPGGTAVPVDGGYLVSGTWRLASAIHHAEWVHAAAHVERDPSRLITMALRVADVDLLDSWDVVGLAGTGSNDFSLHDHFVPASLARQAQHPYQQLRGARRFDVVDPFDGASYEHLAFAIGAGRRALTELQRCLTGHAADREVVQDELGEAMVTLHAIEAAATSLFSRVDAATLGDAGAWTEADRHLPRALAAWATRRVLALVQTAFQRSGAAALRRPSTIEKLLRDMSVAATHAVVSDTAYSVYSHHVLESHESDDLLGGARRAR